MRSAPKDALPQAASNQLCRGVEDGDLRNPPAEETSRGLLSPPEGVTRTRMRTPDASPQRHGETVAVRSRPVFSDAAG